MSDGEGKKCSEPDTALPVMTLKNGSVLVAHHNSEHDTKLAVFDPVKEGECLNGKALYTEEGGVLRRMSLGASGAPAGKPAKVTTESYRSGWDAVFGKKEALN